MTSYQGSLWLLGGGLAVVSDIWSSQDGQNWELVSSSAPWGSSTLVGHALFQDKIWVFGGHGHSPSLSIDLSDDRVTDPSTLDLNVWRSTANCKPLFLVTLLTESY